MHSFRPGTQLVAAPQAQPTLLHVLLQGLRLAMQGAMVAVVWVRVCCDVDMVDSKGPGRWQPVRVQIESRFMVRSVLGV